MCKNRNKFYVLAVILLLAASMLTGCGAGYENAESDAYSKGEIAGDVLDYESSASAAVGENVSQNRKIIENVYLSVQTKEFDGLLEKLEAEIKQVGGYVESSSVYGNDYEGYSDNRRAEFTIRIPSGKSDEFTAFIADNSTVASKEIETTDVTLSYVDIESRINALEIERATLEDLLSKSGNISDIIQIRDRLTDVIYEIESYQSKLRTYDNLVDYATISVSVYEVDRITVEEEQSIWQEIGTNFKDGFKNIIHIAQRLFVVIISGIPYLLLLGIVAVIVLVIVKISTKHQKKKDVKPPLSGKDDNFN